MSFFAWSLLGLTAAWLAAYGRSLSHWRKGAEEAMDTPLPETVKEREAGISIVVPFRNEKGRLEALYEDLREQIPAGEERELLFVDDHSEDGSKEAIRERGAETPSVRLLELSEGERGKKEALDLGIREARYERVLTLDGDVRVGGTFLDGLERAASEYKGELYLLPVLPFEPRGPFQHLIHYEALALLGILIGSVERGEPLLANGAGMLFDRRTFFEEGGYEGHFHIDSGDDLFLLQNWVRSGKKVSVLPFRPLLVRTRYPAGWKEWLDQRLRWASKSKAFEDPRAIRSLALIGGMNFLLVLDLILLLPFHGVRFSLILISWGVKGAIDRLFLTSPLQRLGKGFSWKYFPLALLLYPFQLTVLPLVGLFRKPEWKGRRIQDH